MTTKASSRLRNLSVVTLTAVSTLALVASGHEGGDVTIGDPIADEEGASEAQENDAPPSGPTESSDQFASIQAPLSIEKEPSENQQFVTLAQELARAEDWTTLAAAFDEAGIDDNGVPLDLAPMYVLMKAHQPDAADNILGLKATANEVELLYEENYPNGHPSAEFIPAAQTRIDEVIEIVVDETFDAWLASECEKAEPNSFAEAFFCQDEDGN